MSFNLSYSNYLWYFVPALIENARYSCSHSITRASWCGNVIGDMEMRFEPCFTLSSSPCDEPITNAKLLYPFTDAASICCASCVEETSLPSMHSV